MTLYPTKTMQGDFKLVFKHVLDETNKDIKPKNIFHFPHPKTLRRINICI